MKNRPSICAHMLISSDLKCTGPFLERPVGKEAAQVHSRIHKRMEAEGTEGFIISADQIQGRFAETECLDLEKYTPPENPKEDFTAWPTLERYLICFDPFGQIAWSSAVSASDDPAYADHTVVQILTHKADPRYLGYLREKEISYFFAGEETIDVRTALEKLRSQLFIRSLLLEGDPDLVQSFLDAGCLDSISLVLAYAKAGESEKPLFEKEWPKGYRTIFKTMLEPVGLALLVKALDPEFPAVPLEKVEEGFLYSGDELNFWIDTKTGEEYGGSTEEMEDWPDDLDLEDPQDGQEALEAIDCSSRFVLLPKQEDLDSWQIMEDFKETVRSPYAQEELADALRGRRPYRHFKDALAKTGLEDAYYSFEEKRIQRAAREWCLERGLIWY